MNSVIFWDAFVVYLSQQGKIGLKNNIICEGGCTIYSESRQCLG